MPHIKTPLSTAHGNFDNTEAFVATYETADDATKNALFAALTPTWSSAIENPFQFGHIISCLKDDHMREFYRSVETTKPTFLKNLTEFTQICAYLDPDRITLFCNINAVRRRLNTYDFIDTPEKFRAIFSVFSISSPDGEECKIYLDTEQLLTVFNIIKSTLFKPLFFRSLNDFVTLFPLIPTTEDKIKLLNTIEHELPTLIKTANDINHIQQTLKSPVNAKKELEPEPELKLELELFKKTRETIYRSLIIHSRIESDNNSIGLDKAFHAMLFLIFDNYPGNQPEKLKSIIETTFSDPSTTELKTLLEKTESAMRFIECNITSTRLQKALTHLIKNLRTEEKKIDVDHIIQLAINKNPFRTLSIFEAHVESETQHTAAQPAACRHEF